MSRIPVNTERLTWAHERAGRESLALAGNFPKLISGDLRTPDAEPFLEKLP